MATNITSSTDAVPTTSSTDESPGSYHGHANFFYTCNQSSDYINTRNDHHPDLDTYYYHHTNIHADHHDHANNYLDYDDTNINDAHNNATRIDSDFTTFISEPAASTTDASASSSTSGATITTGNHSSGGGGLSTGGKIAVAVVVPIAAVAMLVLAGIWLWRRRKQRKDAEEQRRKEVEDYTYNPNADPTIPAVAAGGAGAYEMKEDGSSGYRGWGSTTVGGSTGRKASTTMSGGAAGGAYSDAASPTRANMTDSRSGEPLMDGSQSPDGEILGAMGPSASMNRNGDVQRGPSNASSSYSAAARSDNSGEGGVGVAYGNPQYYDQYGQSNPYADNAAYGASPPAGPSELPAQPVIRDNPARRNTRIENPSHYPQQSAGISQNF
ncbi:Transmembrane alpha-helix domain-containing protein [Pleurostoma richardsiae]|uniref:Transmembrane alpha-helix domain-containing protein n=1 Tax=Pleurostoma richardsiae TaxID=41990 RepID=A0AA38RL88_9PEZI|nr:Transmembrane alpha-helix domain-containing protein [Pleurostoma richardsiae]